jgi:protoporphyrinogen/coproporphyrinogen III oxidase
MTPEPPSRIAIVGGGIAGLATAWQLTQQGIAWTLFEASDRLGGIVETVHRDGFVIECGPDSWVTEKPWARELAVELGLEGQIIPSNDQGRRTYVQQGTERQAHLIPIPDGMRMMIPSKWGPLLESPLFSWQARLAYLREPKRAAELKESAPAHDESVYAFVRRHFGDEVVQTIAGPLLAAVFGGDIAQLSARAVMPAFVRMEAEEGSLIQALQRRATQPSQAIFTSLAGGLGTLVDRMVAMLPPGSIHLLRPVQRIEREHACWRLTTTAATDCFDAVVLATPPHVTRALLPDRLSRLLPQEASSAIVVALAFDAGQAARLRIPRGFGFIVPPLAESKSTQPLLACTFVDQKFPGRVPEGAVLLRAFFGGASGDALLDEPDEALIERARQQLSRVLGPLPPAVETVVRRWPQSLPQYAVGHLDRITELESLVSETPGLHLVGSAYHGVGLPDLIRDGRALARFLAAPR